MWRFSGRRRADGTDCALHVIAHPICLCYHKSGQASQADQGLSIAGEELEESPLEGVLRVLPSRAMDSPRGISANALAVTKAKPFLHSQSRALLDHPFVSAPRALLARFASLQRLTQRKRWHGTSIS
jgi:hypothetical protein